MEMFVYSGQEEHAEDDAILRSVANAWVAFNEQLIKDGLVINRIQDDIVQAGEKNWVVPAERSLQHHAPELFNVVEAVRSALMKLEGKHVSWLQPANPFEIEEPIPEAIFEGALLHGTHALLPNFRSTVAAQSYRVFERKDGLILATDAGFHATAFEIGARLTMSCNGQRQAPQRLAQLRELGIVNG